MKMPKTYIKFDAKSKEQKRWLKKGKVLDKNWCEFGA